MTEFDQATFDEMTGREKLQWVIDGTTYKRGWKLWIVREEKHYPPRTGAWDVIQLIVSFEAENLDRAGQKITIHAMESFYGGEVKRMTVQHILEGVIRPVLIKAEMHEMDEWLKFHEVCVRNPHPKRSFPTAPPGMMKAPGLEGG